jgi:stringent starvation protein B
VTPGPAEKRATLLRLLAEGMVLVHLDARSDGVSVPEKFATDPELRLNLSYRFASRDLTLGPDALSCTLSFGGFPFLCVLPYPSIFAVNSHVTGEAVDWRKDAPAPTPIAGEPQADVPAAARPRGHLRLVK